MKRVLIVDDDEATCAVLALALGIENFECRVARTILEALASLDRFPLPDVILLDLRLPPIGGEKLIEYLAADPAWKEIPVIIMSAWHQAEEVARKHGTGLLLKPFSLTDALEMIERLTSRA